MHRLVSSFATGLIFLAGCASTSSVQSTPATPVRLAVVDQIPAALERSLRDAGWEPEIKTSGKTGTTSLNVKDAWDETATQITFAVRRPEGNPVLLATDDSGTVLKGLRTDLRKAIQNAGGEVIETAESEAYREKALSITYSTGKVTGTLKVVLTPATDRPEETANRLQLFVREHATP